MVVYRRPNQQYFLLGGRILKSMVHWFGSQRVSIDDSVVHLAFTGIVRREEIEPILAVLDGVLACHGCYATLIDAQAMRSLSAEARKCLTGWKGTQQCYGNAIAARTTMTLVARAIQLFTGKNLQLSFFTAQSEACAWIDSRRPCRRTEAGM